MRRAVRWILLPFALAACGEDGAAPETPRTGWFVDRTEEWGLDFGHEAGLSTEKHLPETMGAGAALVDVDGDGDLDLYLLQGGPMRLAGEEAGTFLEPPGPLPTNQLWLNDGAGHFANATAASGDAAHTGYAMGVCAGDVNGDGAVDLYVTNLGDDVLLLGDGAGSFQDGTRAAGLGDGRWTGAATFFDADGDGHLDLYVAGYLEVDLGHPMWCGKREDGWRSVCHPDAYPGLADRFWKNRGDGTFERATAAAGFTDTTGKGLGTAAFDADDDGDLDLYVANDSTENRLWINLGDGRFEDGTLLSGTGVNGRGATEAGMGIAVGDTDGDGRPDLFVTNFDDESNTLYANEGDGIFRDVTAARGLEAASRLPVGFGTVLADFDHDGDLDLAVANGHIVDNIALYHDGKTHAQRAQLFENDGRGRFRERPGAAGALAAEPFVGRGLYSGDLDGDGDLDLLLTQCGGRARLLENIRPTSPGLVLTGLAPGSRVVVRTRNGRRFVRPAGSQVSYFGQCAPGVHLGLAAGAIESLTVRPPLAGAEPLEVKGPLSGTRFDLGVWSGGGRGR